jgi:hypothetical protein
MPLAGNDVYRCLEDKNTDGIDVIGHGYRKFFTQLASKSCFLC